ncbi:MAG: 50S ribosomal protein L35 [Fimbriimonadales bacterium]
MGNKLKTSKTAAKRFKISGTGKILRRKAYNSHMFFHKSGSQKRRLENEPELAKGDAKRVAKLLGI